MIKIINEDNESFESSHDYDWFINKVIKYIDNNSYDHKEYTGFKNALNSDDMHAHDDAYEAFENFIKEARNAKDENEVNEILDEYVSNLVIYNYKKYIADVDTND